MYGMVNQAIQSYIENNYGEDVWQDILTMAHVDHDRFEQLISYDDDISYRLVGAIGKRLDLRTEQVLETFGEFWPVYAMGTSFKELVKFGGDTFLEALDYLDEMHERVKIAMPNLNPPSFEVEKLSVNSYRLHYYSQREGLAPMVTGLLYGLARQYETSIEVRHISSDTTGRDHDYFDIIELVKANPQTNVA